MKARHRTFEPIDRISIYKLVTSEAEKLDPDYKCIHSDSKEEVTQDGDILNAAVYSLFTFNGGHKQIIQDIPVEIPANIETYCSRSSLAISGIHELESIGLTFVGCAVCDDSMGILLQNELLTFIALYWDGSNLRAYMPTSGNPWNTHAKLLYGRSGDSDYRDACERWPELKKTFDNDYDKDVGQFTIRNIPHMEIGKIIVELKEVFRPKLASPFSIGMWS